MHPYISFFLCALCYLFCGTVSMLLSANLPNVIGDMLQKTPNETEMADIGAYLSASFIFGWMLGGLSIGYISDRIGRVKALSFAAAWYGFYTVLVVFVIDWQTLMLLRFFAGFGVGGVLLVSTVYLSETWKEDSRASAQGFLGVFYPVGIVLSGAVTSLFSHWQVTFWIGVIPIMAAIVIFFYLPESEMWKSTKFEQRKIMINENEGQSKGLSQIFIPKKESIFAPQYRSSLINGAIICGAVLIGLWGLFSWLPTWVQSLLQGISDGQQERGNTMMILGLGGILGGCFSGLFMQKIGSRKTLMFTFSGMILACGLLFLTNKVFSPIIYAEMAFLSMFFGLSQGALSAYIPALFPANIRATATGFCFNICRFFTVSAVFFVGTLVSILGGFNNALLSFTLAFVVAFMAAYYSEETELINN
jgi:MFS family permease